MNIWTSHPISQLAAYLLISRLTAQSRKQRRPVLQRIVKSGLSFLVENERNLGPYRSLFPEQNLLSEIIAFKYSDTGFLETAW